MPGEAEAGSAGRQPPNMRLKLTAPVVCDRGAFVNLKTWRRDEGAH